MCTEVSELTDIYEPKSFKAHSQSPEKALICFAMSIRPSVCPHATGRPPLYKFAWSFK